MARSQPDRAAVLAAYHDELTAAFAARCCRCGAAAAIVIVGDEPLREAGILLKGSIPDRNYCLGCAGWLKREAA